ncbi:MAG: PAS domain-containing sensor histidine kinase [Treponema sp.]|jgi:signal transduction histidine kinase|nr:PAS domain-containing sensor histidine kinase [Treponema sp.]
MRHFIKKALHILNKLTSEQICNLLVSAAGEIERLEAVLNSLTSGILVCNADHNLIVANKCAKRFLSLSAGARSKAVWHLIRDKRVAAFLELTLCSGDHVEEWEVNLDIPGAKSADAKQRLLSFSVLPLVRDRKVGGSVVLIEDITEKRNREERMRRMESLASLTTMAAGVAHEIKNPLGSLSIHIQLMQKAINANRNLYLKDHPNGHPHDNGPIYYMQLLDKYLTVVNEEIDRLNHIVVDFLFAVRPMDMNLREGNINTVITELTEFVGIELELAYINTVLELAPQLPLINFDERYMKQALLNLIKNAMAAMDNGGMLTIKTQASDADLLISVCDTGVGIVEENLPKIFEPYFTTKPSGSGLGLTLVYKIVREHQGEISVKSKPGGGTCFIISLPIPQKECRLIGYDGNQADTDAAIAELRRLDGCMEQDDDELSEAHP